MERILVLVLVLDGLNSWSFHVPISDENLLPLTTYTRVNDFGPHTDSILWATYMRIDLYTGMYMVMICWFIF